MKVHFACSTSKLDKYDQQYLTICKTIKSLGHSITRDWIEEALTFFRDQSLPIDRESIYKKVTEAILASDVLVVEGTVLSFSVGHQVSIGLQKNKPVLFLIWDKAKRIKQFNNTFLDGMRSPLISIQYYNFNNLEQVLKNFFQNYQKIGPIKFNIVLPRDIDNYLDWASYVYKMNKSEFIRSLIQEHIDHHEPKYRKFLEKK